MQEEEINFSDTRQPLKKEILDTLEHIDTLQRQSINRFDKPEIHRRVFQLLDILDAKLHDFNHGFENPTPKTNQILQNLLFNLEEMKKAMDHLKLNASEFNFQQAFIQAKDQIRKDINQFTVSA